ncbi:MAG: DUF433 domain-containing protein [Planctomycetota bacterium]
MCAERAPAQRQDVYGGRNPAEIPAYTIPEAAHWLQVPYTTTRAWLLGQHGFAPVVEIADRETRTLSFQNLVELHVLAAIRRKHGVSLQRVRTAVEFMEQRLGVPHPLRSHQMLTDGQDLLVEWGGQYLSLNRQGHGEMRAILEVYLSRIELEGEIPARLYPFSRREHLDDPRAILIDPRVQFGRPCVAGTGIPTAVIADRWRAGESIDGLADDYGRRREEIEETIRYEIPVAA